MRKTLVACGFALSALLVGASLSAVPTLVGKQAPDFALRSMDGKNRRLSEFRGQVVLVNFWARWAGDSRQEMPALDRINTTYHRAGLIVLGVSVDEDSRRQRFHRVVIQHRNGSLREDGAGIQIRIDEMDRTPAHSHPMRERPRLRIEAGERRQ